MTVKNLKTKAIVNQLERTRISQLRKRRAASAKAQKESGEEPMMQTSVDEDELLELGRLTQEEDVSDVELSEDLFEEQREDARK